MARQVFYSFHYVPDSWRASQVRNIGKVEGNKAASDNDWETIAGAGEAAIKRWIDDQMEGRSCAIVLIGKETADRKWINYEIEKAWNDGKGLVGIHIHVLKDRNGAQTAKGRNPFSEYNLNGVDFDQIVKTYDPPTTDSQRAYAWIADNIETWIDDAIETRGRY